MKKYLYKDVIITYAGFKMEGYYCFYGYFENYLLYLKEYQIKKLKEIVC
jgi:hypothetical protein